MRTAAVLLCVGLLPIASAAQEIESSPQSVRTAATAQAAAADDGALEENLPVPSWARSMVDSFSKPLHPVIGGVASGGGFGVGVGYDSSDGGRWYREGEAMVTVRRYWSLEGEFGRRSLSKRSQIGAFGAVRHMGRLDYFGIGPDTTFENRSAFTLRETAFGARGWFRVTPALRLGGSAAVYIPNLGPGVSPSVRSIEEVFARSSIPGGDVEPTFGRYRAFVELRHPAVEESESYRGTYQGAFEVVRDLESGRHDFHRWEAEVQQRIPGFRPGQRLTLHGFVASTNTNADVPFYMLYTLGGSGGLKTFRPDLLGGDTRASLRGFRNYRFRDHNLLLMQAEYRIPLHRYVHSSVFFDAGQVAPHASALFSHLRTSTGFSLSLVRKEKTVGRMDVGFGGGEGVHVMWSFGAF